MKHNLSLYYIICFLFVMINQTVLSIYVMLPLHSEQNCKSKKKLIQSGEFTIFYKGVAYQTTISSSFGTQIVFKDEEFISKYYIMICKGLNLEIDTRKDSVKGYNTHENYKMYVVTMKIFNNKKNEMTYNWDINEVTNPLKLIPENTIIIYGDPKNISLRNFEESFNQACPTVETNKPGMLILPTISLQFDNFSTLLYQNANASLQTKFDHSVIKQIH